MSGNMNIIGYQVACTTFLEENNLLKDLNPLYYYYMGLASEVLKEVGEIIFASPEDIIDPVKLKDELGDVTFYTGLILWDCGLSELPDYVFLNIALPPERLFDCIIYELGNIAQQLEKVTRKDNNVVYPERSDVIKQSGCLIFCYVNSLAIQYGFSLKNIMDYNIGKLQSRYS